MLLFVFDLIWDQQQVSSRLNMWFKTTGASVVIRTNFTENSLCLCMAMAHCFVFMDSIFKYIDVVCIKVKFRSVKQQIQWRNLLNLFNGEWTLNVWTIWLHWVECTLVSKGCSIEIIQLLRWLTVAVIVYVVNEFCYWTSEIQLSHRRHCQVLLIFACDGTLYFWI